MVPAGVRRVHMLCLDSIQLRVRNLCYLCYEVWPDPPGMDKNRHLDPLIVQVDALAVL